VTKLSAFLRVAASLVGIAAFPSPLSPVITAQVAGTPSPSPIPGFADSLYVIGDLLERGRGIEAENICRALLARVETVRGRDVLEVADVLDLLGRAVRRSSKVSEEEKRAIAERSLAIREHQLGPAHPDLATSLLNVGVQRALGGDPAGARPSLERALAIREAAFGPDHVLVAGALQSLAGLLLTLHDDARALGLLERALEISEQLDGAGHPRTIRTLVNLAILHQETGDVAGARRRYERARVLADQLSGPADLLTLHVLAGVAVVLSELAGDSAGAARLNERLVALTEQAFGPTDRRLRTPLDNLAMDRRDLGDYAAAQPLAERAVAIAEGALGANHPEVAKSLYTRATIFAGLGDYSEAMRLFERATRINEEVLQPSNPEGARAAWFIPDLLPLAGYGSDDIDLFERVIADREKHGALGNPGTAESFSNLAAMLSSAEDFQRTRPLFERAFKSQERFLGPDHPEVAAAASNLATVLSHTGESESARLLYERALSIWEQSLGADHPKVATGLRNLARLYLRAGNYHDAGPLLARALAIQEKGLGPEHPDVGVTLSSRAVLAAHNGATSEAFDTAARAEALSREHRRLTVRTLPERQALAYASSLPTDRDLMLRLASSSPGDSQMVTRAWSAVIGARGMVLDEMAARHRSAGASEATEIAGLAAALASARQRLAALSVRGVRNDPPERYRRLLEDARAETDRAGRALAEHSARFRDGQASARVLLPDVSAALPPDSALVAFVRYQGHSLSRDQDTTSGHDPEPSYLAFVLKAGESRPALVPLGRAAHVDGLVLRWRKQLDQEAMAARRGTNRGEAAYRRVAGELRQQLWDPLAAHLSNATRLFVVPDGALHLVNFAALPVAMSQYLVETGPVMHYLSAERDLVPTDRGGLTGWGLLALGGPAFDDSSPGLAASGASFRSTRSACHGFQSLRFDPLPAALKEVDDVVTLWNQAHDGPAQVAPLPGPMRPTSAIRLTGIAASEAAFKAEAPGRRILHVATHGFFLGARCAAALDRAEGPAPAASAKTARDHPLLLSGLILAGANNRHVAAPGQEDGILTAEEVAALDLTGVEWAVLSGCDTGVGEVRAGEGVFGLRRAFQVAGARTVIISLWQVEDQATRQWMTTLYKSRFTKNQSTMNAVREAGLAVLRGQRAKGLSAHPFYWAAFVSSGDWR
jgi:CHAT domain-containing protein/tetratricopeptide (TPR) repeat protein